MRRELKWGIFLSSALIAMFLIFILFGEFKFFEKGYNLFVTYNFTNGLDKNAPVRLSGVNVGTVEDINMAYDQSGKIHIIVKLWIRQAVRLKEDSRFYINTLGLLGEKYIEISPGTPASDGLTDNSTVVGIDPLSTEELFVKGNEIADNLRSIMSQLNKLVTGETLETVVNTLESITATMNAATGLISENRSNVKSATNNLNKTSSELVGISKNLYQTSAELNAALKGRGEQIAVTIDRIESFSRELEKISATMETINKKIERGEGNLGLLVQDDKVYKNLEKTLEEINALVTDMKENPKKYIKLSVF